jgi:hypothetical protein
MRSATKARMARDLDKRIRWIRRLATGGPSFAPEILSRRYGVELARIARVLYRDAPANRGGDA